MLINEQAFKTFITQAIQESLPQQDKYHGFADVQRFSEISGISVSVLRAKVLHHPQFQNAVYKFDDDSRKYYIDIVKGIDLLKIIMKRGA